MDRHDRLGPQDVSVFPDTAARSVGIENGTVRVVYRLDRGTFDVHNQRTGTLCLRNGSSRVDEASSTSPLGQRTWSEAPHADRLGRGRTLTIVTETPGAATLIQQLALYAEHEFVSIACGLRNTGSTARQVREVAAINAAQVFPDVLAPDVPMTLDGMAGWDRHTEVKTRVERGSKRWSYNNLLYTFRHEGARHCLVLGGLTHFDFAKYASIDERSIRLFGADPVGRRVEGGEEYVPADRFYLGLSQADPFAAMESYAMAVRSAHGVQLRPYDFPTVCAWYAFRDENHTPGCVRQADAVQRSGFLRYAPVAIRLVPDTYGRLTEQGWWDDEHWQKHGHYRPPYETTEKWCRAMLRRGCLPFTYVQTGMPSDDYAQAFPGHMLRNDISLLHRDHMHHLPYVSFDYTDPDFQAHLAGVWGRLANAGMRGVMFDYPETGWREEGGFEDASSTVAAAYRRIFGVARHGLGPDSWIHERNLGWPNTNPPDRPGNVMGDDVETPVLDNTVGLVNSQRVETDTKDFSAETVTRCGLRWYKCRTLFSYDMDSKSLPDEPVMRRAILTMTYVVSGRLLLATPLSEMNEQMLHDLSRIYPMHAEPKSARPIDAFTRPGEHPRIYDFPVTGKWHQLCLFNPDAEQPTEVSVALGGQRCEGALALAAEANYYVYDFWNDRLVGKLRGADRLTQKLAPGEARMLSVHAEEPNPQFLSTNRHLMQGYMDLSDVAWDPRARDLVGRAKVVAGEPFRIVIASNDWTKESAAANGAEPTVRLLDQDAGLVELTLKADATATAAWRVHFAEP